MQNDKERGTNGKTKNWGKKGADIGVIKETTVWSEIELRTDGGLGVKAMEKKMKEAVLPVC